MPIECSALASTQPSNTECLCGGPSLINSIEKEMVTVTFIHPGHAGVVRISDGRSALHLTERGKEQARQLAEFFSARCEKFHHIYASCSRSASSTAAIIFAKLCCLPGNFRPSIRYSDVLTQQLFGATNGTHNGHVDSECVNQSLLRKKAEEALENFILRHLHEGQMHVAIVAHQLMIAEIVNALSDRYTSFWTRAASVNSVPPFDTAWTRIEIWPKETFDGVFFLQLYISHYNRGDHLGVYKLSQKKPPRAVVAQEKKLIMNASNATDRVQANTES